MPRWFGTQAVDRLSPRFEMVSYDAAQSKVTSCIPLKSKSRL
jgi:hypothetical protein